MTLRVAHLIVGLGLGGAERMLVNLVGRHEDTEELVITMTDAHDLRPVVESSGVRVAELGMRRGVPDPRSIPRVKRVLRAFKPDVLQTWMYHADLLGGLAARSLSVPVVWNVQSTLLGTEGGKPATSWVRSVCARMSRRLPERIVACAESARRVHTELGYDGSRMLVIPNGVDPAVFAPDPQARAAVRDELQVADGEVVIANVARFHPYKDHATLIAAFGSVSRAHPEARLVLVGTGMDTSNGPLMEMIARNRVSERISLLGPRQDVARVLNALDVFVLSSTEEALPNALLEAMACELPTVTTDVGDCRTVVGDGGVVVPPARPDSLAAALVKMIELDGEERQALGRRARARILETYSMDIVGARYLQLWREVASR